MPAYYCSHRNSSQAVIWNWVFLKKKQLKTFANFTSGVTLLQGC